MAVMTSRESIKAEAEEADKELAIMKAAQEKEEAERLAKSQELSGESLEEIFAAGDSATDIPGSGIEVKVGDVAVEIPVATGDKAAMEAIQAENARLQSELSKLQTRFESTFGNFNKQGMAELTQKVKDLEKELSEVKTKPVPVAPAIIAADREEMVKDLGEPATRVIEFLQGKIDALETSLNDVTGQVKATGEKAGNLEATTAQMTRQSYFATLDAISPDWRKINGDTRNAQDPKFTIFLDKSIPGTDLTYNDAITAYHQSGNAVKVAEIFTLFKSSDGKTAEASAGEEEIPEPGKSGGGTPLPKAKTDKRTYTQAEIEKFDQLKEMKRRNPASVKNTFEQIEAVEADIQDAIREGRVRK